MSIFQSLESENRATFLRGVQGPLSYSETLNIAERLAGFFLSQGISAGDRVCLLADNSKSYVLSILALLGLCVSVVPLSVRNSPREQQRLIRQVGAKALLIEDRYSVDVPEIKRFSLDKLEIDAANVMRPLCFDLASEAFVVFTSGSGGVPKGVSLTLASIIASAKASNRNSTFNSSDSWLLSVPLFHVSGIGILFRVLISGGSLVLARGNSGAEIKSALDQFGASFISVVPTQLKQLLELSDGAKISPALKVVMLGGGGASSEMINLCAKSHDLIMTYGMTESSSHVVATPPTREASLLCSAGFALAENKISILNSEGLSCAIEEQGAIAIESDALFSGYIDPQGKVIPRGTGKFVTSDVGYLREDGALVILGRSNRMIKSGGEKIHLDQIEQVALRLPYVLEAAAIGLVDLKWGERPKLFLKLSEESAGKVSLAEIQKALTKELPRFKVPEEVVILPQIPKTALGKIDYQLLSATNPH